MGTVLILERQFRNIGVESWYSEGMDQLLLIVSPQDWDSVVGEHI
jgi:hypothetical protein